MGIRECELLVVDLFSIVLGRNMIKIICREMVKIVENCRIVTQTMCRKRCEDRV